MMEYGLSFFIHPLFRGPLWGAVLVGIPSAWLGVFLFVQRRSLLTETLSHAAYPGAALSLFFIHYFPLEWGLLVGAALSAGLGFGAVIGLQRWGNYAQDCAQTAVLSSFFGIGLLLMSYLQFLHPREAAVTGSLFLGQVAFLHDHHLIIYGALALGVGLFLLSAFRPLHSFSFEATSCLVEGGKIKWVERLFLLCVVLTVVVGMRTVGIVLLSALFIAPAVSARQCCDSLRTMLVLAPLFNAVSCLLGVLISFEISSLLPLKQSVPTGPMIALVSTFIALCSLLFAPKKGFFLRGLRSRSFQKVCQQENLLKRCHELVREEPHPLTIHEIVETQGLPKRYTKRLLNELVKKGWMTKGPNGFTLSLAGCQRVEHIESVHILWEKFVEASYGLEERRAHLSAEQMEHVLNDEMERELKGALNG